jgi:hypothetical protein
VVFTSRSGQRWLRCFVTKRDFNNFFFPFSFFFGGLSTAQASPRVPTAVWEEARSIQPPPPLSFPWLWLPPWPALLREHIPQSHRDEQGSTVSVRRHVACYRSPSSGLLKLRFHRNIGSDGRTDRGKRRGGGLVSREEEIFEWPSRPPICSRPRPQISTPF